MVSYSRRASENLANAQALAFVVQCRLDANVLLMNSLADRNPYRDLDQIQVLRRIGLPLRTN